MYWSQTQGDLSCSSLAAITREVEGSLEGVGHKCVNRINYDFLDETPRFKGEGEGKKVQDGEVSTV